ncbi:MAG: quinone-dependent dihydroorotate dehydrogenase [Bacteroidia bacterium]|nr:quinone-dependent dihydroorotate dehydrogenase [Bacteroidia bacterium]
MYRQIIRPVLFQFDPEQIHHFTLRMLRNGFSLPLMPSFFDRRFTLRHPQLERTLWGLTFKNPVGLAAGFDKDGILADWWKHLGFGFAELGTVTPRPQPGNPRQRLFRLPEDQAILNRMGFNNAGVAAMVKRLKNLDKGEMIIGVNIGKNKDTSNENAVEDYLFCLKHLFDYADYFVVNVSSPNTPGLRSLQEKEPLTRLLGTLQENNQARSVSKPLLLKIAPDLSEEQLDDVVEVARITGLNGLIATNTTLSREGLQTPEKTVAAIGNGGLSGKPLTKRASEVLRYLHHKTEGNLPLIGVGGIMNPTDAQQRLEDGASLIQIYSGFIYEGPGFVRSILESILNVSSYEKPH